MNEIQRTQRQGYKNLISIAVIGVAVYIGFEPLIELVPDGVAKSVISSSFGAIFVIILTMYLLNKQTEIEQQSKKSEKVFDEKVHLYQDILKVMKDMMADGRITLDEMNRLPFSLIQLSMLGRNETIQSFREIYNLINLIYASQDNDTVVISDDDKQNIFRLLTIFAATCRNDLQITTETSDETLIEQTVSTLTSTGKKKRDYTKFVFNGKSLPKNRYLHAIVKDFVDSSGPLSLQDFTDLIPVDTEFKKGFWVELSQAEKLHEDSGYKRYFSRPDEVIMLNDASVCISNGTNQKETEQWIAFFNAKGIRTE